MRSSSQTEASSSSAVSFGFRMRATSTSGGQLLEQIAADGGLARPHLAGELDEAARRR